MRFKTRVLLAVGCVSLLAMSTLAFSLPAPHGVAKHRTQTHRAIQNKALQNKNAAQHSLKGHVNVRAARLASTAVTEPPKQPMFGWPALVSEARKYIGTNPTDRKRLWCATFMNFVLGKVGYAGTHSDAAKSFAQYGHRVSEPQIGSIAVLTRGNRGGHVGVVTGIDSHGNPIIISGNHGHRVGEATYSRARVIAYVMPSGTLTESQPLNNARVAERPAPARSSEPTRSSERGLESPITELLAAIEAEQTRAEAKAKPARPAEPPTPHLTVQQLPERVQQTAQQGAQPVRRELRRDLPLDPALAKILGIKERAPSAQPQRPVPQRQQRVQQRPARVASVAPGLPAGHPYRADAHHISTIVSPAAMSPAATTSA